MDSLDSKYRKALGDVAFEVVDKLYQNALECAWTSTAIPFLHWELQVADAFEEVVIEILKAERKRVYLAATESHTLLNRILTKLKRRAN